MRAPTGWPWLSSIPFAPAASLSATGMLVERRSEFPCLPNNRCANIGPRGNRRNHRAVICSFRNYLRENCFRISQSWLIFEDEEISVNHPAISRRGFLAAIPAAGVALQPRIIGAAD